jgi:hypothetical protein
MQPGLHQAHGPFEDHFDLEPACSRANSITRAARPAILPFGPISAARNECQNLLSPVDRANLKRKAVQLCDFRPERPVLVSWCAAMGRYNSAATQAGRCRTSSPSSEPRSRSDRPAVRFSSATVRPALENVSDIYREDNFAGLSSAPSLSSLLLTLSPGSKPAHFPNCRHVKRLT